ncbi:hypothetical protein RN001_003340 [Aquatica leii]|uniref:DUF4806 domain-containing protein n=1 Tax=Aquatica leii TaxID=1421715 RepID=A0AAN7SM91_9COLE|nr:hypothetical protein RN001_003340 [Aquatica leii]
MYAIVTFPNEKDAPGIIATNGVDYVRNICYYPNVESHVKKLLMNRTAPEKTWNEHPIRILKEFNSFRAAELHLSEAELTSNIESSHESENYSGRKRTVRKKKIHLPGEEVSSEEDYDVPKERRQNISTNISYPVPPTTAPKPLSQKNADCNNSYFCNYQNLDPPRLMNQDPFPTQLRYTNIGEPGNSYAISGESSSEITYDKDLDVHCNSSSVNLPVAIQSKSQRFSNGYANSESSRDVRQLHLNQEMMWSVINELSDALKRIKGKLDNIVALLHSTNEVPTQPQPQHNSNNELIALLPINEAGFDHLNTTLADSSSFKQKLTKILLSVGGKDVKAFIANILRKLISDDLAQLYSLTGKLVKNGGAKKSFEKTETFRFIYDISIKAHKDAKESVIREGISDWLMQAKFRKNRRDSRKPTNESL